MADRRRRDVRDEAKRKRGMLCEDATVEAATVESNDAVQRSDELNKQDSAGNQLPAEGLPKGKKEIITKEVKVGTRLPCASEPEEKTHFERVDAVARPAVSKGKRKNSLRWKTDSPSEDKPSGQIHTSGPNEYLKTTAKEQLSVERDGNKVSDEPEERTKFEHVNVKSRPAVSKGKRKSGLKWKGSDFENNRQTTESTTLEETVTQDQGETQDDSGTANERTKFEMVAVESRPAVSKHRRKNLKWKDSDKEVRRNANGGTVEDSNNTQASADSDADKLVTQEEAGNVSAPANVGLRIEPKISLSRSVRALELIRNAELVDGTLSDKENASVAAFFANPAILRTHTKRLVSKALGSAMDRLKEISTDEDLKQFFEDRPSAIDDMFQELLNNRALLPSCWILTEALEKLSSTGTSTSSTENVAVACKLKAVDAAGAMKGPEKMKTVAKTPKSKETKGNIEAENATQRTRASTLSKAKELEETKEVVKSTDETRGVRKVLELATPWGRRRKSWRKSDRSHRSEKSRKSEKRGRPQKEEEQTKQQQKATELDEREKKAWQETEAERRSFLAFALPAAYRFFNWK